MRAKKAERAYCSGGAFPGLVVDDDEGAVLGPVDAVEDAPDRHPVELLDHVELPVERLDPGGILDGEVVGEELEALDSPAAFVVDRGEEVDVLLGRPQLRPRRRNRS